MQFIKRKLSGKPTGPYCIAQGTLLNAVAAWIRAGVWGRMDTCVCVAESPHCPPETTTALLIGYTPI